MSVLNLNTISSVEGEALEVVAEKVSIVDYLKERDEIVTALEKCNNLIQGAYTSKKTSRSRLRLLELRQSSLFKRLENIDQKICEFKPRNSTEAKLSVNVILDIYKHLNDIETDDKHFQLIRDIISNF